jgi:hypothetical protein
MRIVTQDDDRLPGFVLVLVVVLVLERGVWVASIPSRGPKGDFFPKGQQD